MQRPKYPHQLTTIGHVLPGDIIRTDLCSGVVVDVRTMAGRIPANGNRNLLVNLHTCKPFLDGTIEVTKSTVIHRAHTPVAVAVI